MNSVLLGSILLALGLSFLAQSCGAGSPSATGAGRGIGTEQIDNVVSTGTDSCQIQYGYRGDDLLFVVFTTSSKPEPGGLVGAVRTSHNLKRGGRAWIESPDGSRVPLPTERQLVEVIDGNIRLSDRRFTKSEVEEYVESGRRPLNLRGLIEFADRDGRGH